MNRVKNKTVIVTGGALGIGRGACIRLAEEGAKVAVTDINEKDGIDVVDIISKKGGIAKFWHLNTADEKEVEQVARSVNESFGKIDGLVNNAGVGGVSMPTDELTESDWDSVMNVNAKGVFFCTKHVIPYMKKNRSGSIVNISSVAGLVGVENLLPYCASKGAVRLMTKADAMTFAKDKIRVNSIHPAFIWTQMVESFSKESGMTRDMLGALHPLGFIGEPDDVAYAILYLISDESRFMTGSELVIDGGVTAQ